MKLPKTSRGVQAALAKTFKLLPQDGTAITRLQGDSFDNPFLVIAPPPTEEAIAKNFAWCGPTFQWFLEYLRGSCHIMPDPKWLILPACMTLPRRPARISQTEAQTAVMLSNILMDAPTIKRIVVVGAEAYRMHMGFGSRPPGSGMWFSQTAGPASKFKLVLTLPDLDGPANLQAWRKSRTAVPFKVRNAAELILKKLNSRKVTTAVRAFFENDD